MTSLLSGNRWIAWCGTAAAIIIGLAGRAEAQSGSIWGAPEQRRPMTLADGSWTYQQVLEPKQMIKLHDLLTVLVREKSRMSSEGQMDQRKKIDGATLLSGWFGFNHGSLVADPLSGTQPGIVGAVDNKFRTQANLQEKDSLEFSIACEVVDIRPNGTLVVEGHRKIQVNEEEWEYSVGGVIRPEDLLPNNSVQSEKIADLRVLKRQAGHARDGVRRGWLLKWLDTYQAF